MKMQWLYKLICLLSFKTIHLRCRYEEDGIHCVDCGFFKSRAEHLADMEAGGGW